MPNEPDHLLLRRYHVAREQGHGEEAARIWERLAENSFDRIKQTCAAFRYAGGTGLPPTETGSAATEAYLRVVAMGRNFREREIGQFRAAVYRTVHNACLDYGRKELRHQRRAGGSLDERYEPDGEAGPYDAALARYEAERKPIVKKLVTAARTSAGWYEHFPEHMKHGLMDFAYSYITRSGRIDDARLRAMSPAFMARYEASRSQS